MDRVSFAHPCRGEELDWLAVDLDGHLGVFSSAGHGPVPEAVVEHLANVRAALDALPDLPILGNCTKGPTGPGDYSFWLEPARRGIFGYDWGPTASPPYARLAVPSVAAKVSEVADDRVREAALLVVLPIRFVDSASIGRDELRTPLHDDLG